MDLLVLLLASNSDMPTFSMFVSKVTLKSRGGVESFLRDILVLSNSVKVFHCRCQMQ